MFRVEKLSCERNNQQLFTELSFSVAPGQLVHIHGTNGSGKTTLLRILANLYAAFSGKRFWCEQPLETILTEFYSALGFIGHKSGLKLGLTALENLNWHTQLTNAPKSKKILMSSLDFFGLGYLSHRPCLEFSAGQLRKTALASLLANKKSLWLLDEPFTALDKQSIAIFSSYLNQHLNMGGMAIVSSHQPFNLPDNEIHTIELNKTFCDSLQTTQSYGSILTE